MRNPSQSPSHIVLVGPMGAGKSCIGHLLASRLGRTFVDLDACIEAGAGMPITAIFASEGEAGFRVRERLALAAALAHPGPSVIATGGGAVLDPGNRMAMQASAIVAYLQVDPCMQLQRLAGDATRPLLAGDDPARQLATLQQQREALYREVANLTLDTSTHTPASAVEALVTLLARTSEQCA